jgi:hypothetical protein
VKYPSGRTGGAYSKGEIIAENSDEMKNIFTGILNNILNGKAL